MRITFGGGLDQQIRDRLPELKAVIQYMPDPLDVAQREAGVMAWDEFLQVGKVRPQPAALGAGGKGGRCSLPP